MSIHLLSTFKKGGAKPFKKSAFKIRIALKCESMFHILTSYR